MILGQTLRSFGFLLAITASVVSAAPVAQPQLSSSCTYTPPPPAGPIPFDTSVEIPPVTAEQILSAAPQSGNCATFQFPEECTSNTAAAQRLNEGFAKWNLNTLGQKAALISYMAFESQDFNFNINHFPGRPGQGTKSMMNFPFLYSFAATFPDAMPVVLANSPNGQFQTGVNFGNMDQLFTAEQKNNIRATVLGDDRSFQSAMWFVREQPDCTAFNAAEGLSTGGEQGWRDWNSKCLFIGEGDESRRAVWCKALNAIKPANMALPAGC